MNWVGKMINLPLDFLCESNDSIGGGVIQVCVEAKCRIFQLTCLLCTLCDPIPKLKLKAAILPMLSKVSLERVAASAADSVDRNPILSIKYTTFFERENLKKI